MSLAGSKRPRSTRAAAMTTSKRGKEVLHDTRPISVGSSTSSSNDRCSSEESWAFVDKIRTSNKTIARFGKFLVDAQPGKDFGPPARSSEEPVPDIQEILDLIPSSPDLPDSQASRNEDGYVDTNTSAITPEPALKVTARRRLFDITAVRRKRDWTVFREIEQRRGSKGLEVKVKWANTLVPGPCIQYDEDVRAYVEADGMRHYIAEQSSATTDSSGHVTWDCRWEDEFVPVELINRIQKHEAARLPTSGDTALRVDMELRPFPTSALIRSGHIVNRDFPRSTSTVSAITFSSPEAGELWSLHFHPTNSSINYATPVHELIEQKLGTEITTAHGGVPKLVQRRLKGDIVRPLQFHDWCVKRKSWAVNFLLPQHAEAALVHMKGQDVLEPCRRCMDDRVTFQGCVVGDGFGNGECTNCHYGKKANKCSFRRDTIDKDGYRAARRIRIGVDTLRKSPSARPTPISPQNIDPQSDTPSSPPQSANDVSDFVFGPSSSPPSRGAAADDRLAMSGGLGPQSSDESPVTRTDERASIHHVSTSKLPVRKRRGDDSGERSVVTSEAGKRARRSNTQDLRSSDASFGGLLGVRSSPSIPLQDNGSIKPELAITSTFERRISGSTVSQHQKDLFPNFHESKATVVFSDERFEAGSLTEAQMWYIFKRCEHANQALLRKVYNNATGNRKMSLQLSFADFMSEHCTDWLNKDIIPLFGLPRTAFPLDDN